MEISEYQPKGENTIQFDVGSCSISEYEDRPNEDSFFISRNVAGVFDGVGGIAGGEEASTIACNYLGQVFTKNQIPESISLKDLENFVGQRMHETNYLVYTNGEGKDSRAKTTAVLALIQKNEEGLPYVLFANVGDSRGYVLRDGKLYQITVDDNDIKKIHQNLDETRKIQDRLNRARRISDLTPEEQVYFNYRNKINQALGVPNMNLMFFTATLKKGDRIILCTDGVSDNLTTDEMEKALRVNGGSQEVAQNLVNTAFKRSEVGKAVSFRSKRDDITAVVISPNSFDRFEPVRLDQVVASKSRDQMIDYLIKFKGVETSSGKFLTGKELAERVAKVLDRQGEITLIPRAGGLRERVSRLLRGA